VDQDTSVRFSPSRLDTYRSCPRKYRFRYVDKLKVDAQSMEAFLGTCVHSAFERLYEDLMHGRKPKLADVLETFEKEWADGFSDKIVIRGDRYSAKDWKDLGRQCVEAYYEAHKPFERDKTVAVERQVGFDLEVEGHHYQIQGYVDRLSLAPDGTFEVHDYKTSGSLPTQADKEKDWQLPIYEIAVRRAWPDAAKVKLIWHFVRFGKSITVEKTPEQLDEVKAEIARVISAIKADHEFVPKKSALCDWCEYRDLCPLFKHPERIAALAPEARRQDEGVKLADQYASLELRKKQLREQIKQLEREQDGLGEELAKFAEAWGLQVVAGSEGEVAVSEKEDYKFPTKTHDLEKLEELEALLKDTPLWKDVSRLDGHLLMEGYKKKKWAGALLELVESAIGRYVRRIKEKTLRFRRRKEPEEE
jgi:putative RecB family exonuclease